MKKQIEQVGAFHKAFGVPKMDVPEIPDAQRVKLRISLIEEELSELKEGLEKESLIDVADALCDIQYVLLGTVLEFGLHDKFEALFNEVHSSNMSKLDENGKAIYREDGKVMKSERYFRPDLQKILDNFAAQDKV